MTSISFPQGPKKSAPTRAAAAGLWRFRKARRLCSILAFLAFLFEGPLLPAQPKRGLSTEELSQGLSASGNFSLGSLKALDGGRIIDAARASNRGSYISFSAFEEDIKNNRVFVVERKTKALQRPVVPYGYKNCPVVWEPSAGIAPEAQGVGVGADAGAKARELLFLSLAGGGGKGYQDGIYLRPLRDEKAAWILFEAGAFRNLALSGDGRCLFADTGNYAAAFPRSSIVVWRLDREGRKQGERYGLAGELKGQIRKIAPGLDAGEVYFETAVEDPDFPYGKPLIYVTANKPASRARLLVSEASDPSPLPGPSGRVLLYFRKERSSLARLDTGTGAIDEVMKTHGLYLIGLESSPGASCLVLGLQVSGGAASLVEISPR